MSIKGNIRRILFVCLSILAGATFIVFLIAAVNARNHQVCKGFVIQIKPIGDKAQFVDNKDIEKVLTANNTIQIRNKPVRSFNLDLFEARLKQEPWVKDAEIFFTNSQVLKVIVEQRQPIARIFSSSGGSFYIDSSGQRLPLSNKVSAKLPVFTSYPIQAKKTRTAADKKLIREIKDLSMFLLQDPFWMAQISQIDITPSKEFEMVPTIGNHIVEFGDGQDYLSKFRRLFVFYRQVLAKTGMEKYERIKVQYNNEVIGVKKENN
jgi:cell division protein FtsQ